MAKFKAEMLDLVVSTEAGFITFKNGFCTTTDKKKIDALKKANGVVEVGGKPAPAPKPKNIIEKLLD